MDESTIKSELSSLPDIYGSILEFFEYVSSKNRKAYVSAIQNSCIIAEPDKYYQDSVTNLMTQSFAEYYYQFKDYVNENENIMIMQQMLIYSLFWENSAVLRLLDSFGSIVETGDYIIPKFGNSLHSTNSCITKFIRITREHNLSISNLISHLYFRQIRNAAVHAQLFFFSDYIRLENYNKDDEDSIPIIHIGNWGKLYLTTCEFIESLFDVRRRELDEIHFV